MFRSRVFEGTDGGFDCGQQGTVGEQSFGGAQLLNRTPFEPFTQPIVRLDLDRMDDDDNRLFGITAQISWVPNPSYQLTVRTPLYLVKN